MASAADGATLFICDSIAEVQARPFLAPPSSEDGPETKWAAGDDALRAETAGSSSSGGGCAWRARRRS